MAVFEVAVPDEALREAILNRAPTAEIHRIAVSAGMTPLLHAAAGRLLRATHPSRKSGGSSRKMSRGFVITILVLIVLAIAAAASGGDPEALAGVAITILCVLGLAYIVLLPITGMGGMLRVRLWMFPSERERLVELYCYLARWMRLGHDLPEALNQRLQDNEPAWLRNALRRILGRLMNGDRFRRPPRRTGTSSRPRTARSSNPAESGKLPEAFEFLAATTRSRELHNFPVALVLVEFLLPVFVMGFVLMVIVPKFVDIFCQLGSELPWLTMFIVNVSYVVTHEFVYIVLAWCCL